ncbi:MAG: DUF5011 domain-containing protein, partial [Candidatus Latescibacteria bacterium]|nr:DUF5011 domain-containing protein [Candidatus Latescibacterota bacterium]
APTIQLPLGTHTVTLVVNDGLFDSPADELIVEIVDGSAPDLTLLGDNPLFLEVGTPYDEPGATATDEVDGDLSGSIVITGAVDPDTEGTYGLTYQVSDQAGNAATQVRTVKVTVTADSYSLIATNSMDIRSRAKVHSGFVGVVDYGTRPLLGGRVELDIGTRAMTGVGVQVGAPRVRLRNRVEIAGTLIYTEQIQSSRTVTIGEEIQVGEDYWPLFDGVGLPPFEVGTPDNERVDVRSGRTATLDAGAYGTVRVRSRGTLILSGGTYDVRRFEIGHRARVLMARPTTLRVEGRFNMSDRSYFGPENDGLDLAAIRVYVNGEERRTSDDDDDDGGDRVSRAVGVGHRALIVGRVYAPHGTIYLHSRSRAVGSFIAYNLIVGRDAEVWGRGPVPPAAKRAGPVAEAIAEETVALGNYPNPFNPETTLHYALPQGGEVQLVIYSALGQKVRTLVVDTVPPGSYAIQWDGRDAQGLAVASGVYLAQLRTGEARLVRKLILMR